MTAATTRVPAKEWEQLRVVRGTAGSHVAGATPSTGGEAGSEIAYLMRGADANGPPVSRPSPAQSTFSASSDPIPVPAVVVLPLPPAMPREKFTALSRREGVVLEIRADEFDARLTDLDGDESDLEATFAIDELSPDDVPLLRVGAVFYWNIGYYDDQVRRRTRVSELRLRRLPAEDPRGLDDAAREADEILHDLGIE